MFSEDFFILSAFDEIEGPITLSVFPESAPRAFSIPDFVLRIMTLSHPNSNEGGFQFPVDSQSILTEYGGRAYAYVHNFILFDIQARGYVRPLCLSYITSESRKLTTFFDTVVEEMVRATDLWKLGNLKVFYQEVCRSESDLSRVLERWKGISDLANRHNLGGEEEDTLVSSASASASATKSKLEDTDNDNVLSAKEAEPKSIGDGNTLLGSSPALHALQTHSVPLPGSSPLMMGGSLLHAANARQIPPVHSQSESQLEEMGEVMSLLAGAQHCLEELGQLRHVIEIQQLPILRSRMGPKFGAWNLELSPESEMEEPGTGNGNGNGNEQEHELPVLSPPLSSASSASASWRGGGESSSRSLTPKETLDVAGLEAELKRVLLPTTVRISLHQTSLRPVREISGAGYTQAVAHMKAFHQIFKSRLSQLLWWEEEMEHLRELSSTLVVGNQPMIDFGCMLPPSTGRGERLSILAAFRGIHATAAPPAAASPNILAEKEKEKEKEKDRDNERDKSAASSQSLSDPTLQSARNPVAASSIDGLGLDHSSSFDEDEDVGGLSFSPRESEGSAPTTFYADAYDDMMDASSRQESAAAPGAMGNPRAHLFLSLYPPAIAPIGSGLLTYRLAFSWWPRAVHAVLCGRPLIVMSDAEHVGSRDCVIHALSLFVAGPLSARNICFNFKGHMALRDLQGYALIGVDRPREKLEAHEKHSYQLPRTVEPYFAVIDLHTQEIRAPSSARSETLDALCGVKRKFTDEVIYLAHCRSLLMSLASKALMFYHLVCLSARLVGDQKEWGTFGTSASSHSQMTSAQFIRQFDVAPGDMQIIAHWCDVVKRQQYVAWNGGDAVECQRLDLRSNVSWHNKTHAVSAKLPSNLPPMSHPKHPANASLFAQKFEDCG